MVVCRITLMVRKMKRTKAEQRTKWLKLKMAESCVAFTGELLPDDAISEEGEKVLYTLARRRDRDEKDVQQVRVIKDEDGNVLTDSTSVIGRWKEYFEELVNEEIKREQRDK
ncbi:hypothetical protein XENORESO_005254 [Xenotaenia resolanae]|uniref:Uncharacterized protein n=1 Tax=Xenotaenia resolanae TaxID=208358 RepID=A0ABV0VXQ9_9TELE